MVVCQLKATAAPPGCLCRGGLGAGCSCTCSSWPHQFGSDMWLKQATVQNTYRWWQGSGLLYLHRPRRANGSSCLAPRFMQWLTALLLLLASLSTPLCVCVRCMHVCTRVCWCARACVCACLCVACASVHVCACVCHACEPLHLSTCAVASTCARTPHVTHLPPTAVSAWHMPSEP